MSVAQFADENILCLRILLVGINPHERAFWVSAAAGAPVPVEFVTEEMGQEGVGPRPMDICLIDAAVPPLHMEAVIQLTRIMRPAPLILLCGSGGSAKPFGADGVVRRPAGTVDARSLLEICIRAKLPSKVLLVDDSTTMRSIVKKILVASRFNLNIEETNDGVEAIRRVRAGHFDLAFLDYNMPGLNGFATLAELRKTQPQLAVVMITSALENGIADRAQAAGAYAFLKKPFYASDVDAILRRYYSLIA